MPKRSYGGGCVCRERRLIIEVDGGQHVTNPRAAVREAYLIREGYRVLRFRNNDVLANIGGVLETIAAVLQETPPSPDALRASISPRERGEVNPLSHAEEVSETARCA